MYFSQVGANLHMTKMCIGFAVFYVLIQYLSNS